MSQSAISQHLAIMRAAGLVKTRRQAQQIFYSVQDEKTAVTATMLLNGRCTMEEKLKILHLPMMYEWFDKIASGEKTTEYRQCSDHWNYLFTTKNMI